MAAAVLVLATLGGAIAIGTWRANEVAEKSIRESLAAVPGVFQAVSGEPRGGPAASAHERGGRAGNERALRAKDQKTLHDWTVDKAQAGKLDAGTVFLFDERGVLLDRSDQQIREANRRSFASVKWVADALKGVPSTAVIREKERLSYVASVPVLSGDASVGEGRLAASSRPPFRSTRRARRRSRGSRRGRRVSRERRTARRASRARAVRLQPAFRGDALVPALARSRPPWTRSSTGPARGSAGRSWRATAASSGPCRSRARRRDARSVRRLALTRGGNGRVREDPHALLWIGAVALLLALPVSFAMGRRIARPLEQLAGGAAAIREGNLDVKLPEAGGGEVGALARAFPPWSASSRRRPRSSRWSRGSAATRT